MKFVCFSLWHDPAVLTVPWFWFGLVKLRHNSFHLETGDLFTDPLPCHYPSVQPTRQEELECLLGALTYESCCLWKSKFKRRSSPDLCSTYIWKLLCLSFSRPVLFMLEILIVNKVSHLFVIGDRQTTAVLVQFCNHKIMLIVGRWSGRYPESLMKIHHD